MAGYFSNLSQSRFLSNSSNNTHTSTTSNNLSSTNSNSSLNHGPASSKPTRSRISTSKHFSTIVQSNSGDEKTSNKDKFGVVSLSSGAATNTAVHPLRNTYVSPFICGYILAIGSHLMRQLGLLVQTAQSARKQNNKLRRGHQENFYIQLGEAFLSSFDVPILYF